jgi:hypothetical protein
LDGGDGVDRYVVEVMQDQHRTPHGGDAFERLEDQRASLVPIHRAVASSPGIRQEIRAALACRTECPLVSKPGGPR